MPITVIIHLRACGNGTLPRSFHCLMHPVLLERIEKVDTSLAYKLHNSNSMPPFSLSPIMESGKGICNRIRENQSYWVRIAILDFEMANAFLNTLDQRVWMEPIRLEQQYFEVEDIQCGPMPDNAWSGADSYQELFESSSEVEEISVRIVSPMAFKKGDLNYPLPDPPLVFGNLLRRWNQFTDNPITQEIEYDKVTFAGIELKTIPYLLRKGGTVLGCVGRLTFLFDGTPDERRYCHTLLQFAFYSGIGVKTPQGMGMCRIFQSLAGN